MSKYPYEKLDLVNYLSIILLEQDGNYAPTQDQIDAMWPAVMEIADPVMRMPVKQQTN